MASWPHGTVDIVLHFQYSTHKPVLHSIPSHGFVHEVTAISSFSVNKAAMNSSAVYRGFSMHRRDELRRLIPSLMDAMHAAKIAAVAHASCGSSVRINIDACGRSKPRSFHYIVACDGDIYDKSIQSSTRRRIQSELSIAGKSSRCGRAKSVQGMNI